MAPKTPNVWLELVVKSYPDAVETIYRFSDRPLAYPTMIDWRIPPGGWSEFELAMSFKGTPEASSLSANLFDTDTLLRQLIQEIGVTAYQRVETRLYLLSTSGRRAGLAPRIIHRGFLKATPSLLSNRKSQVQIVDVAGSQWFGIRPNATMQKQLITREHLEAGGIINTPKNNVGVPYPAVIGEHSDKGRLTTAGTSAEKGYIPLIDIGDLIMNESNVVTTNVEHRSLIPPPDLYEYGIVGTPGPERYVYGVSAIFNIDGVHGETAVSQLAIITNGNSNLDASNYTYIKWRPPAGWEDIYDAYCIGIRIGGRYAEPPNAYLDTGRHAINGDGLPDWTPGGLGYGEYHDDDDSDDEKVPGPPEVGNAYVVTTTPGDPTTVTTSRTYGVFVYSLGYAEMHNVFGPSIGQGTESGRTYIDPEHPEMRMPSSSGWPFPDPWIEVGPAGDTIRVSAVLFTGNLLKLIRDGNVTPAANGCGWTDTGDDTGVPITEAAEAYIAIINELLLKNNGKGYRTGNFFPLVAFADGTTILNTDVIRAYQAQVTARMGTERGPQFHFYFPPRPMTLTQFEEFFNTTFFTETGPLSTGQRAVWTMPAPDTDLSAKPVLRHKIEIPGRLPDANIADDEVENIIKAKYDYNPDDDDYVGDAELFQDTKSQDIYGQRPATDEDSFLECRCTRDQATFRDAMAMRLYYNKVAPIYQPVLLDKMGFEFEMGTIFLLTHPDGDGEAGYVDRPFFIVRRKHNVNRGKERVTLTGRDLGRAALDVGSNVMDGDPDTPGGLMPFVMFQ